MCLLSLSSDFKKFVKQIQDEQLFIEKSSSRIWCIQYGLSVATCEKTVTKGQNTCATGAKKQKQKNSLKKYTNFEMNFSVKNFVSALVAISSFYSVSATSTCGLFQATHDLGVVNFINDVFTQVFDTADGVEQVVMSCGSGQVGLKDLAIRLEVSETQTYTFNVNNGGDSTMQIHRCDSSQPFVCNDDKDISRGFTGSAFRAELFSGVEYIVFISVQNGNVPDFDFTLRINPSGFGVNGTAQPTLPPNLVLSPAPSAAPGKEEDVSSAPSAAPVKGEDVEADNQVDVIGPLAGGLGGAAFLLGSALLAARHQNKRRSRLNGASSGTSKRKWSEEENFRLKQLYVDTRDFDLVCLSFPDRSAEDVARQLKKVVTPEDMSSALTIPSSPGSQINWWDSNSSVVENPTYIHGQI